MADIYCNDLTLTGPKEELERFCELFKNFDNQFTYQAIIPAPDGLDIPESSAKPYAIALYLYQTAAGNINNLDIELIRKWDPENSFGLLSQDGNWAENAMYKVLEGYNKYREQINEYKVSGVLCDKCPKANNFLHTREELYRFGEQLIRNRAETGRETWYDWNCANWGVKWDAGDCNQVEICGDYISLLFTSVGDAPKKVLQAITERFPLLKLTDEIDCAGICQWTITGENGQLFVSDF